MQVRHDSLYACAMTYSMRTGMMSDTWMHVWHHLLRICDMTHSYVWHDLFHMSAVAHLCDMTPSYVWHDSLHTYEWVMSQVHRRFRHRVPWLKRMSHGTLTKGITSRVSCRITGAPTCQSIHIRKQCHTHMNESWHAYIWVRHAICVIGHVPRRGLGRCALSYGAQ